ncbi:hypothetical protein CY34DRAFT_809872 [Suillus luteus UH-Slu-Lm8-n1]|uniref:Uncharacterized protein n=1 Tax=Suillus luteus UH-Slu-Lm8-n1 TaxID=930992 RepID=A0A0D0AUA9_9AGAM|nr:hypothetical protein CY34DRAFT_809872 [Suillus luteus UH-Slu-Lm8-n1]
MPKASKASASTKGGATRNSAKQIPKLLVLKHGQKRVMTNRHKSYETMLDNACKHFPTIPRDAMAFQTNKLDICEGHYVEITAETWDKVVDLLSSIEVTRSELPLRNPFPPSPPRPSNAASGANSLPINYHPHFPKPSPIPKIKRRAEY